MNGSLRYEPYSEYKPSGIDWLGDVPAHWEVRRLGLLATKFGSGITPRGGATVYQEAGIPFLRSQNIHFDGLRVDDVARISERLHDELRGSHVQPGDVLLNITGASIGRVCSVPMDFPEGNVNQHVCIIRPRKAHVLPGLLSSYLSTPLMQGEIYIQQIGASREGLTLQSIRNFPVPLPPLYEQTSIVRYLDRADYRIRRAISVKERLIELLTEQRQAVIHRAVTRGLDPNAPLKDSGVEWLGDVPKHWEVKKLRHILEHVTERNRPDLPLLSVVREQGIILRDVDSKEENHNFIPDDLSNYKVVNSGQFAMNKMKAWQGSFGVSQHSGIVSPAYFVFNIKGVQGTFFHRAIRSKAYVPFFGRASDGVRIGQWDLSQARMREIPFLTPPRPEQSAVVRYLDKATADIDTAIDKAQRQIDLLREYRTRLIADVVTGQVDVRGAVGDEVELPVS